MIERNFRMTINSFILDRVILVGLMMAGVLPFFALAPAPARAATVNCAAQAFTMRTQAELADPKAAAQVQKMVRLAEKICGEGNRHETGKKFAVVQRLLDSGVVLAARR